MRAALTGATGFVGTHLLGELLAQGHQVRALTRRPQKPQDNLEWIEGDLDDRPALARLVDGADVVFNVAGRITGRNLADFETVNAGAVTTLLDMMEGSTAHFIHLSSLAARERHLSDYAESKARGEDIIHQRNPAHPWTILRPPGIYGPGDFETLKIFKSLKYRLAVFAASRKNRAAWIFVKDLAQAMNCVAGNKACFGAVLDVDEGRAGAYSVEELYDIAAKILGVRPLKVTLPKPVLKMIAHANMALSRTPPMLSPAKVEELCYPDWVCRGTQLGDVIDWTADTSLEEGLERTLDWYRGQKYL